MVMDTKAVIHGMQQIDSWPVEAVYRRSNRGSTGTDDEFVVTKESRVTLLVFDPDSLVLWIDARREMVCQNLDTWELGAMRKMLPIRSFPAEKEWKPTNAEIWKRVGQNHSDACRCVKLMCSKGSADSSVTAPDYKDI